MKKIQDNNVRETAANAVLTAQFQKPQIITAYIMVANLKRKKINMAGGVIIITVTLSGSYAI